MPRRVPVGESELAYLTDAVAQNITYTDMAAHIGCCVDTIKRILQRHGLAEFDGAKYQTPPASDVVMWTRPCSSCGDTTPRPKWQFRCGAHYDLTPMGVRLRPPQHSLFRLNTTSLAATLYRETRNWARLSKGCTMSSGVHGGN